MRERLLRDSLFLVLLLLFGSGRAAASNYWTYHRLINEADSLFFVENRARDALKLYDQVGEKYDFVFAKDLFTALQIAGYCRDTQRFYRYLVNGFQNGLTPAHLAVSPILVKNGMLRDTGRIIGLFNANRSVYLKRINQPYLSAVYQLFAEDEVNKQMERAAYNQTLQKNMARLITLIDKWGFPSDQTIGIDDSAKRVDGRTLQQHYRQACKDLYRSYVPEIGRVDNNSLAGTTAIVFLVHHPCSYYLLGTRIQREIERGNLHPRDAALLYDNIVRIYEPASAKTFGCGKPPTDYFKLMRPFRDYPTDWRKDREQIDSLRRTLAISSVRTDSIRKAKMAAMDFYSGFGFWSCR